MAVFAWVAGNPFDQPQDDQVFYDAVSDVSSDVFHYAADQRLAMQRFTYSVLTYRTYEVRRWIGGFDPMPSAENWAIAVTVVTLAILTSGYINPYLAVPAFVLDAYNIYRYFV